MGLFTAVLFLTLSIISIIFYRERQKDLERELENVNSMVLEIIMLQVRRIAGNQLREDAHVVRSVVDFLYREGKEKGLSDGEIRARAAEYLSRRRIGLSGYFYVLDSSGSLQVHPHRELEGNSLLEYDFIRSQVKRKEGYLEYLWKNPGEAQAREKALYMTYFEPLDWIISASAYRDEFVSVVPIEEVRESWKSIPVGNGGYPFLLDREGDILIHPELEGQNLYDVLREQGKESYLDEFSLDSHGTVTYDWTEGETGKTIRKVLLYRHIPELGWTVVTAVPMEGYTGILERFYLLMVIIFFGSMALFYLVSKKLAVLFTEPLVDIMAFIGTRSLDDSEDRLVVTGHDEFSLLSREVNNFLDAIEEETNNRLIAEEENRILAQFTNGNPYPVMRIDEKGNILYVNKASIALMKYWEIAFHTRLPADLVEMIGVLGADFPDLEYKYKNRTYNVMLSYFEKQKSYYLLISDITVRKEEESLLLMSESVFSHTMEGILITNPDGTIVRVNPAFTKISGYEKEEVLGLTPRILSSDHHNEDFYREMWRLLKETGIWSGEVWNRKKSGEAYPEWLTINSIHNEKGELIHYVGIFKDISDIKESEEKLRYQVSHDALTGLPNRILFEDRLNRAIARAKRGGLTLAVLFLDMDNFKNINDSLGHQAGDDFLKIIADRLLQSCRAEDTVARLGGDEFVVLIPELTEQLNIIEITNRIQTTVGASFLFNTHDLHPSVSIGVTVFPEDGDTPQLLMKNADLAMYKAKELGKGTYSLFNKEMNRQVKKRMDLESQLKKSLQRKEMDLVYQPKVAAASGEITGVEALIRWGNDKMGVISPGDFIPLTEETGFIHVMGDWVLNRALRDLQEIGRQTGRTLEMAVNLSPRQFRDKKLIDRIEAILSQSGISPSLLNFEITEHAAMDESEESLGIVTRLRQLGVRLSIDDFGTGYSSYSYLTQFRMHCLKIDKSFIDEVDRDEKTAAIMSNIIDLGHTLNMEVVAEGVETAEQVDFLVRSGCDVIQGFYFYKPMILDELIRVMTEGKGGAE
ncbi:MAG: EAL domain-containing protein [Spirochaetales bacterium]|nr:EAL domain-containing protein [Spirochaetales bacterium]